MNAPQVALDTRESMTLEAGQRLGDFAITRVVGHGGFGIVYEAEDLTLQRRVAIKEYLPSQLASRSGQTVRPISKRYEKTFELGRRSFLAEARLLAQFHHPGLLEVLHFWEQNGTAYMVMPFYEGRTLEQVLADGPDRVDEAWLKAMIRPVLDALEHMHAQDCYHRDVSADNILIRNDGGALLLDLGAARRVIGESDRALTVMLKSGYAPIEQYADDPSCRQGPWTDIYAVAAVLHFAVTNRMPQASASRVMYDSLPALAALTPPGYSRRFLEAIDRGLSIRPEQRPRTVGEFRSLLFSASPGEKRGNRSSPSADAADASGAPGDEPSDTDASSNNATARRGPLVWIGGILAAVLVAGIAWFSLGSESTLPAATQATQQVSGQRWPADEPISEPDVSLPDFQESATTPGTGAWLATLPEAMPPEMPAAAVGAIAQDRAAQTDAAARTSTGTVRLSVSPWGEVFVDGTSRGVTPPLKQLVLDAGSYRIEIRNPAGPVWTKQIEVAAGQRTTVSHRFQ